MGRDFRDSSYSKSVTLGRRTIKAGECAGLWNWAGEYKIVEGPKRVALCCSRISFMDQMVANEHEYLVIQHREDGRKEHLAGPVAIWNDPMKFKSVRVERAVQVASFESVVVYSENHKGVISREIISGPTLFIPEVNQWLHTFSWHGAAERAPAGRNDLRVPHRSMLSQAPAPDESFTGGGAMVTGDKVPNALKFTKLRTIADQLYCSAKDVRTADDALLTIKVMIFYNIEDVEKMLDSTHDPIGDFINAVCADLMKFGCTNSYEDFVGKAYLLSELDSYPVLLQRASSIGYKVNKVVYRGYEASKQLQDMQDKAIKSRTEMRLKLEKEDQDHQLLDMEVGRQMQRKIRAHEQEKMQAAHEAERQAVAQKAKLELEAERQTAAFEREREAAKLRRELADEEAAANRKRAEAEAADKLKRAEAEAEQRLAYIKRLGDMGVDITAYLLQQARAKPDKVLQVVNCTGSDHDTAPHLHLGV